MAVRGRHGLGFVADCLFAQCQAETGALWVIGADDRLRLIAAVGVADVDRLAALRPGSTAATELLASNIVVQTGDPCTAVLAVKTALSRDHVQQLLDSAREALSVPTELDRLRARAALVDGVLEAISDQAAVIDPAGVVLRTNAAWTQAPVAHREVVERSPVGTVYPDALRSQVSRPARITAEGIDAVLRGALPAFQADYDTEGDNGRAYSFQVDPLPDGGAVVRHVDISFRKHLQRQLAHRATHDPLTGLPNRMVMTERLGQALIRAARTDTGIALLFCDVDHFKQINDSQGHAVGDQVLCAIGRRLQETLRQSDVVARFGGDEFVVLLEDIADEDSALQYAQELQSAATAPIIVEGRPLHFGLSIGISLHRGVLEADPGAVGVLLSDADTAMYAAKKSGRGSICVFDPGRHPAGRAAEDVAEALRAVAEGVTLLVQPIVTLGSQEVACFEAFARIDLPGLGVLSPADFLQRAEETGVIVEIGQSVMRQALGFIAGQPDQRHISVNVSWAELLRADYPEQVLGALVAAGVHPGRLELEILMPAAAQVSALAHLRTLREAGVGITLDAFGRQPVELGMLPGMAASGIKVDRSLTAIAATSERHGRLVRGIVRFADHLGINCTAEGIESQAQAAAAEALGFRRGQGFFFGKPSNPQDFATIL